MKGLVYHKYGTPDELQVESVNKPVPKENEILIRTRASGLNSWDWDLLRGRPWIVRMWGVFSPGLNILGADVAGTVEAVGSKVSRFAPGDDVYGDLSQNKWGGLAEYTCSKENALIKKPPEMSFTEAAVVSQAGVMAMQCLFDHKQLQPGDSLVINGAGGGVGTFAIQIAKTMGVEITAVDKASKHEQLKALGADHVIDYQTTDYTSTGVQYDMIIDVVANRSLKQYKKALKENGQFLLVGGTGSAILQAMFLGPLMPGKKKLGILAHDPNKHLDRFNDLYERGLVKPVIDQVYSLKDGKKAFQKLGDGDVFGKVVIIPDDEVETAP